MLSLLVVVLMSLVVGKGRFFFHEISENRNTWAKPHTGPAAQTHIGDMVKTMTIY